MQIKTRKKMPTARDIEIIQYIYESGAAKKEQIYKILFSDVSDQMCRNVLNRLTTYKFLFRDTKKYYLLGEKSLPIIDKLYGVTHINQIKPSKHSNGVNQFRDTLILACRESNILLLTDFKTYFNNRQEIKDIHPFVHIPDAVFKLEKNKKEYLLFFEYDRATQHAWQFLRMIRFYLLNFSGGFFRMKYGKYDVAFCLIVVPDETRLNQIRKEATNLIEKRQIELIDYDINVAKEFLKYLLITTNDNIKPNKIFKKVWYCLDKNIEKCYGLT